MDADKVINDLNRRFLEPLPEFYNRRIIFWYDDERECEEQLEEIENNLLNAKLIILTGNNNFEVKKIISVDDKTSNFLIYTPFTYDKPEDNWLINIEMYSEEFRADINSIWMDEMGLTPSHGVRNQVKAYRKFFNAKDRRAKVALMASNITSAPHLHLAVMAAICNIKDLQPNSIIKAVIRNSLDMDNNAIYQEMMNYEADNAFWLLIAQATGFKGGENPTLGNLAIHMLLTAATRTMDVDILSGLDTFISIPHQAYCYDFISEWLHSDDKEQIYEVARHVEAETRLVNRFGKLPILTIADTECFPCINECILKSLMTEISDHIIDVDIIKTIVDKRRSMVWYEDVSSYYEGLLQVANMQDFFHRHASGFHIVEPKSVWKEYTSDYYQMDTFYRLYHMNFVQSLAKSNMLLDDLFKHVTDKVEGLYNNWFLGQLGSNWSSVCEDELRTTGRISDVLYQEDFYRNKVQKADTKIFVIISDALRYEVAASLTEQLRRETQSKVELNSCQGIMPTITKFGMAALLPHNKLDVEYKNNSVYVTADGQSTEGTAYRDKVLKNANEKSIALQYKDLIGKKRDERSALVKGMEVVYIYHDKVDEASHTSDMDVFPACDTAIAEIKNMIRIIVNDFGGTHIYVTADHGFLYTYSPFNETDKLDKDDAFNKRIVEYGRRFAILQQGYSSDNLIQCKFLNGNTDYELFAPKENTRFKKAAGINFVHGGISLQEMVVPIIDYYHLRNDSKTYLRNKDKYDTKPVTVNLLSASRKISNLIFSLNFYQTEAVGDNREKATYRICFTDATGNQISDTQKIIADKTSDNSQERTFRCNFNLKSKEYNNKDIYYLVIADETGFQAPQKEEFQIDIAFAVDEFNFFN